MNKLDKIKALIQKIGSKGYRDGSSKMQGKLYHAIPFPEFSGIEKHKDSSNNEYNWIKKDIKSFKHQRVLDIGCANGYFSFNIAMDGAEMVVGYEGDDLVYVVDEEIRQYKNIDNITFINRYLDLDEIKTFADNEFDSVIMLNVHMWIHKQLGPDITKQLMSELCKKCKVMYFQTAHAEAQGMYKVPELKNQSDIVNYLKGSGFTNVRLLNKNTKWGNRLMFVCSK